MIQPGEAVPFFEIATLDGARVTYRDVWQRKHLVLISIPRDRPGFIDYISNLRPNMAELAAHDATFVVTSEVIDGVPRPGVIVADRWGEIRHVATAMEAAYLPDADALGEWLAYLRHECPECEGETR